MQHELPSYEYVRAFVLYNGVNQMSKREYQKWVRVRATAGEKWATELQENVGAVASFMEELILRMEAMSKCDNIGGFSSLCRILPTSAALSSKHVSSGVTTCAITGLHERPCFIIKGSKNNISPVAIHMTLLSRIQSLWTVRHFPSLLTTCIDAYSNGLTLTSLGDTCERFSSSEELERLSKYLHFSLRDAQSIIQHENQYDIMSTTIKSRS